MIFTKGIDSIEIVTPVSYPYKKPVKLIQVKDMSASGIVHVEDFNIQSDTLQFTYKELPQNEYQLLVNWFLDIAKGMQNTFDIVDDLGVTYDNCRFVTPELAFSNTAFNYWGGSFALEIVK